MYVYFVRKSSERHTVTKRCTGYHHTVFNGASSYPSQDLKSPLPALTNANREPLHIIRSGRFVPPLFACNIGELEVNQEIREQLDKLGNMELIEVVFEKLVDLAMPKVGDFSVVEQPLPMEFSEGRDPTPENYMRNLPDIPTFHESIGKYFNVLSANLYEMEGEFDDIEDIKLNFGSYYPRMNRDRISMIKFSRSAIERFPVIWSTVQIYREDAFQIIAPYLNFDYFGVAMIQI